MFMRYISIVYIYTAMRYTIKRKTLIPCYTFHNLISLRGYSGTICTTSCTYVLLLVMIWLW